MFYYKISTNSKKIQKSYFSKYKELLVLIFVIICYVSIFAVYKKHHYNKKLSFAWKKESIVYN